MHELKKQIYSYSAFDVFTNEVKKQSALQLQNITGSFRAFIAAYLYEHLKCPVLYIAGGLDSAERMHDDLELILGGDATAFLQSLSFEPYEQTEPNPTLVSLRMEAMQQLIERDSWICVATTEGIMEYLPTAENFLDRQFYLKVGNTLHFEAFLNALQSIGFKREPVVEQVGQFSVRGGIIDLFTWNLSEPVRIELFGNQIESIRQFDVISQRSIEPVEEITILPNLTYASERSFIDELLPEDTIIFIEDSQIVREQARHYFEKAELRYQQLQDKPVGVAEPQKMYMTPDKLETMFSNYTKLVSDLVRQQEIPKYDFACKPPPDFNGRIKQFLEYLRKIQDEKQALQLFIQSATREQNQRLQEILEEEDIFLPARFSVGTLNNGFKIGQMSLEVLTDHEIFRRFKRKKTYKRFKNGAYLRQLSSLNVNDYVVHIDYGIGQFLGMEMLEFGGLKKECLKIAYRDNDILYVTVDNLNRVQKYSSEESGKPGLTKLGSKEWERTKKKTKEALKKVAAELIRLYAGRKAQTGYQYREDNHWQRELEASFIYEETEDQLTAIDEVKQDMEKEEPMDRLLCGDVGFGKTEVAIRAAFKAIMDGKQVAVLVPTTILAFQHFETFKDRMREFPVEVEMLNRFRSPKKQREILKALAEGTVDVVIGTHRLLSKDVRFKEIGLLIIDEEQRFGVRHKETLKKYRLSVDVLSMTATPIPRTLHMALLGARDLSNIDTPPSNRLPIHTEIINWDDNRLRHIIMREIQRGGQVYFVHNRLETIEGVKEALNQIVPDARMEIAHGRLPEHRLEKVMLNFMQRKFDVLVSSMIIENGLDIPNVNTIIIDRAHKFGLAQLYQLRGRVGRSKQQAYAFLLVPPMDKITEIARKRLHAIQDFTDLGSGYKVALRDLEIRGAGNLLGKEQSGFVQSVGFDLYCKILDQAVKELKEGKKPPEKESTDEPMTVGSPYPDPKLDVDFDMLIPEDYIANELERITVYHRLVNFNEIDQIDQLRAELEDRFGKAPEEVDRFLMAIKLKILASRMYARRIILKGGQLKLIFSDKAQEDERFFKSYIPALMDQKITNVQFLNQKNLGVKIDLNGEHKFDRMNFAKKILDNVLNRN